jgi:hypothetical protein
MTALPAIPSYYRLLDESEGYEDVGAPGEEGCWVFIFM